MGTELNRGKVIIIAEYFRPMRNSAAVQLEELAKAFCVLGIEPVFIVMDPVLDGGFLQEEKAYNNKIMCIVRTSIHLCGFTRKPLCYAGVRPPAGFFKNKKRLTNK